MKRVIAIFAALILGLPLLAFAGFRLWLSQQPDDFRAQIDQFSTLEFIDVVVDNFSPPPFIDRATYDRREYPERGHSPWVVRSSLDGRPRMLSISLAPNVWLAYSTETASLHQLWSGDIDFTGPVYDARHGSEPTSRGKAYVRAPNAPGWAIHDGVDWQAAEIRWRGHGFDPETGALWMRFDVSDAQGRSRTVTEWPDREIRLAAPTLGFERRFELTNGPPIALSAALSQSHAEDRTSVSDDAATGEFFEVITGVKRVGDRLVFPAELRRAHIVNRLGPPAIEIDRSVARDRDDDPFANHDCHTCHNERERVVGPAWSEVALRYAGANRTVTVEQLAARIQEGSRGRWGDVMMTPHPDLRRSKARQLASIILNTEPSEPPTIVVDTGGAEATWTFKSETEPAPKTLHPSLSTHPIGAAGFTPKVGGLAWLPDGRLGVSTWDPDGAVFAVDGWDGPTESMRVNRIAEGLHEPLGLAVVGEAIYVMQKQEITRLVDEDGDGWIDEYRTVANDWEVTSNFHEFGFGLVAKDGSLFGSLGVCVLNGGKSCRQQTADRGTVFQADPESGEVTILARGLRTPNGLGLAPNGDLFVADNQGDWLPSSKLIRIRHGETYGWRAPGHEASEVPVSPPALWLPQNEIGNSPTQPLFLTEGPYAGQVLFGDIYNGGLKRGALEEVDGVLQGAAFHFSGGFDGPINRLLATADGKGFIVGEVGSHGNWGERGKEWFGLERVSMSDRPAFEPLAVSARPGGFEVEFTLPLAANLELQADDIVLQDWFYVPAEIYGGPKYDLRDLAVSNVSLSPDRRHLSIDVAGLAAGRVVYLRFDRRIRGEGDQPLWVNEAWYTLNAVPDVTQPTHISRASSEPMAPPAADAAQPNHLTKAERADGWRLLFDGKTFEGWKIYGAENNTIAHWEIEDGALHFTRDVSFAGMLWNHINPFAQGAVDLMTLARFEDFELAIDWRISEGGNSGIFYSVPNEEARLSWDFGLEMQILDDAGHMDGQIDNHRSGDLYDLQSLARDAARPVGEWNHARIRIENERIQHWLNDVKIADIMRGGKEWNAAIKASKFDGTEGFGRARQGHLTLQDHGDPVSFRNIKIRELDGGSNQASEWGARGATASSILNTTKQGPRKGKRAVPRGFERSHERKEEDEG